MDVENERVKNSFKLIIAITILIIVLFVWDLIVNRKESVKEIISNITNTKIQDSYNGVYTYSDELETKVIAYSGCSFNTIENYILVINDDFYLFRSTCMGTYLKETGKTDDLNIVEEGKTYSVKYKDHIFYRDYKVLKIIPNNIISQEYGDLDMNSLVGIAKETEFEGNYYEINRSVSGFKGDLKVSFIPQEKGTFLLKIFNLYNKEEILYSYLIKDLDKAPLYYSFGKNLAIIERESTDSLFSYKFKVLTLEGIKYDYKNNFPVFIDGKELNYDNNSVLIIYDKVVKYFKIFVGKDKKFCTDKGNGEDVAYYEFALKYNYRINEFEKPEFVKIWREGDSCAYINEYLKEAV